MDPSVLEGVAAARDRLKVYPTKLGATGMVGDWIDQLTDDEVFIIASRANGRTMTDIAIDLALTVDEVESLWDKLKGEWAVLD